MLVPTILLFALSRIAAATESANSAIASDVNNLATPTEIDILPIASNIDELLAVIKSALNYHPNILPPGPEATIDLKAPANATNIHNLTAATIDATSTASKPGNVTATKSSGKATPTTLLRTTLAGSDKNVDPTPWVDTAKASRTTTVHSTLIVTPVPISDIAPEETIISTKGLPVSVPMDENSADPEIVLSDNKNFTRPENNTEFPDLQLPHPIHRGPVVRINSTSTGPVSTPTDNGVSEVGIPEVTAPASPTEITPIRLQSNTNTSANAVPVPGNTTILKDCKDLAVYPSGWLTGDCQGKASAVYLPSFIGHNGGKLGWADHGLYTNFCRDCQLDLASGALQCKCSWPDSPTETNNSILLTERIYYSMGLLRSSFTPSALNLVPGEVPVPKDLTLEIGVGTHYNCQNPKDMFLVTGRLDPYPGKCIGLPKTQDAFGEVGIFGAEGAFVVEAYATEDCTGERLLTVKSEKEQDSGCQALEDRKKSVAAVLVRPLFPSLY